MEIDDVPPPGAATEETAATTTAPAVTEDGAASTTTTTTPPNQTLYINNLNEKIKIPDLKQALYALAGQYGAVVDIVARSTLRTKGQAFVVFRDVSSAAAALRALHGRDLFDKPMRVQYARDRSDAALRTADEGTSAAAAAAIAERVRIRQQRREQLRKQQQSAKRKAARKRPLPSATAAAAATATAAVAAPNNMLFVENLPAGYTEDALRALFGQIGGFCEAKMVPARQGLAFVEYDTPVSAGTALVRLNGLKVDPDHPIRVTFAKR